MFVEILSVFIFEYSYVLLFEVVVVVAPYLLLPHLLPLRLLNTLDEGPKAKIEMANLLTPMRGVLQAKYPPDFISCAAIL